jgi:hypothetical protein
MDYLNIALVAIGLIAALVTFSGETWDRRKPTFIRKITFVGWVSLSLITLTFGLGIYKEFIDSRLSATQNSRLAGQELELQSAHEKIEHQRSELENANRDIQIQKTELLEARQKLERELQRVEGETVQKSSCANAKYAFIQSALGYATSISNASWGQHQRAMDLQTALNVSPPNAEDQEEKFRREQEVFHAWALSSSNVYAYLDNYPEPFQQCLENIFKDSFTGPLDVPSQEFIKVACAADLSDVNFPECKGPP